MNHSFNVRVAEVCGIKAAVLLEHIGYWVVYNKAEGKNMVDGKCWTYTSRKALHEIFSYMTDNEIRGAIDRLVNAGLIERGCFNKMGYDRTTWYTLTEKGEEIIDIKRIVEKGKFIGDNPQSFGENPYSIGENHQWVGENHQPIPNINTYIETDNKPNNQKTTTTTTAKKFAPPSVEEVKAFCQEKGYTFSPEAFVDYYESNGWMVGKNHMKNWKAACGTWQRKEGTAKRNTGSQAPMKKVNAQQYSQRDNDLDILLNMSSEDLMEVLNS